MTLFQHILLEAAIILYWWMMFIYMRKVHQYRMYRSAMMSANLYSEWASQAWVRMWNCMQNKDIEGAVAAIQEAREFDEKRKTFAAVADKCFPTVKESFLARWGKVVTWCTAMLRRKKQDGSDTKHRRDGSPDPEQ